MRKKIHFVISIVIIFTYILIRLPDAGYACSCVKPPPVKEAVNKASAVFSGKVVEIKEQSGLFQSSADPLKVVFDVKKTWKGTDQTQVIVYTASNSASCGFHFELNQEYLVYAFARDGKLQTTLCSRTADLASAQGDLKVLGEGQLPEKQEIPEDSTDDNFSNYILWSFVALGVVVAICVVRYLFRRRS